MAERGDERGDRTGRTVVVTGGARGIGAAAARRFAAGGARVVVADLDGEGAGRVADEIGGLGVACDVTGEAAIRDLVARAEARFGPVELFFSNAGVGRGAGVDPLRAGPFAPDDDWRASFDVHVMAHVWAARAVVPGMLERGRGTLLSTASAAGLLSDLGGCAYSVTKHAAVAFAEWCAIQYGDRGIHVACVCPMGVRTAMVEAASEAGVGDHLTTDLIEPDAVADAIESGLARGEFLILPHPAVRDFYRRRADDTDRWLAGMRRLRARLYG